MKQNLIFAGALLAASFAVAATPIATFTIPAPKNFPVQDTFSIQGSRWVTRYGADSMLQARSQLYLSRFRPGRAVVAVCDLKTGAVRALAEYDSTGSHSRPQMALAATFPAASLIKILTASAALEWNNTRPMDDLPLLGRSHTLYQSQLRTPKSNRYTRITLENAFAKSVNPVFGSLGIKMGAESLRKMGRAMGFNQPQPMLECKPSRLDVPDTGFGLAQVACGYTKSTTISPLHALRIARGIGDDGRIRPLYFTPELRNLVNQNKFTVEENPSEPFVSPATLDNLRTLMAATVSTGTARKGFRRAFGRQDVSNLDMGGKTGSLDGLNPPGRYEWYIGYAKAKDHPDQGIAVAVMVINQRNRTVHASELAALMIRDWNHPPGPEPVQQHRRHGKIRRAAYARR